MKYAGFVRGGQVSSPFANRSRLVQRSPFWFSVFFSIVLLSSGEICAQSEIAIGPKYSLRTDPRVPVFTDEPGAKGLQLEGVPASLLQINFTSFKRDSHIDSTGSYITFDEKIFGYDVLLPAHVPLEYYVTMGRAHKVQEIWRGKILEGLGEEDRQQSRSGGAISIDVPVEIKNKAFQRVFGSGRVGLNVSGDISIRGGFRHEKRSEVKTALNRGSDYNFKMEQTQRFNVSGYIGDKVTVGVDQDSERTFDFDNSIHLKYQGYDDEVVRSVDAGNISLSLPATQFVTFSGKSSGLFGVKSDMLLGNLRLTAIASQEKGESKQISLSGGAQGSAQQIKDYQYRRNTYFFLDEYYRNQYPEVDSEGRHIVDFHFSIKNLELYKSEPGYEVRYSESIHGFAGIDNDPTNVTFDIDTTNSQEVYSGYFIRLEKNKDYFLERDMGYIQMNMPLNEGEVLAVAYEDSTGKKVGDIDYTTEFGRSILLRLVKPKNPRPTDPTWDLEWKNVYYLGSRNVPEEGLEIKLYYEPRSANVPQETGPTKNGETKTYLEIFGLDRTDQSGAPAPDGLIDMNPNIISLSRGELIFPDLRPFDPVGDSELPDDFRTSAIYDTTVQSVITQESKFFIEVKSEIRKPDYELGMNVIPGSEKVLLNGAELTKDIDYSIDYFSGRLVILNEAATKASADVNITYESNQMFQLDRKTILGARAQYDFGENSFIGGTALYLSERTLEQKIRVGRGPMQNFVWDLNTRLQFKPNFLTRVMDALPFVETQSPTTFNFEGEIAQVIPNPNTVNNEKTGDGSGVAYIDDFEGAKKQTLLGIDRRGWTPSSVPAQLIEYAPGNYVDLSRRGEMIWYNPYGQYPINLIWPNRDINPNVPQRVNILTMRVLPADSVESGTSWVGIQRALSAGYADQTESKFLEVWVQGDLGVLHIDLGQISEDVIPNSKLDTEDKAINGIRNDLLDADEDIGLDGMAGTDDFWDINGNGVRDYGEPLSNDTYQYTSGGYDYELINGTEGNENDTGGRRPDSEDINRNGDVDLRNDYFEYSFSLDKSSPDTVYMVGGKGLSPEEDDGWRQYRIPLDEPSYIEGSPDISLIEYARIWIDGVPRDSVAYISIVEINLVGSEWKEQGIASPDDPDDYDAKNDSTVIVTVVNTHDNPEYKEDQPPGVEGVRDRVTHVVAREQSLVLKVNELEPGYNGIIQKTFYQPQNYIHYNYMKMFVYGKDPFGIHIREDESLVEFFLRFGSDKNNYYEIRELVYPGWDERNELEVDLLELSAIKLDESFRLDSLLAGGKEIYEKLMPDGKLYSIVGKPSLTNVRTLIAGVKNVGFIEKAGQKFSNVVPFSGEVWINELRLSNVKKEKGMAYRASGNLDLAGIIKANGQINRQDADFHNVATRFGSGDNRTGANVNVSMNLDKLLPSSLGISIPINANYGKSNATPKYVPGTDIEVGPTTPEETLEKIRSRSFKQGFGFSFRRSVKSKNFFVKHTLDNLSFNYNENYTESSNATTAIARNKSQSGGVKYNINFGRDNSFKPLAWLGGISFFKKLSETKMYYTPTRIDMGISGNRSTKHSLTRTGITSDTKIFTVNRDVSVGFKLFEPLSFDFRRAYVNDLRNLPPGAWKKGRLGTTTSISQDFSSKYTPKLFSWLNSDLNYSANYKYTNNLQQRTTGRSASNSATLGATGSINLSQLLKSTSKQPSTPVRRPPGRAAPQRGARPAPGQQAGPETQQGKEGGAQDEEKEKEKKESSFNILKGVNSFLGLFDPVRVSYQKRNSANYYGLGEGWPGWQFQFGLSDSVGVPVAQQNVGSNRGSQTENTTFSVNSGLKISQITVTLKYSKNSSTNRSTTITGNNSETWFRLGKSNLMLPSWTAKWTGLEKVAFFQSLAQRISVDHAFAGDRQDTWNIENDVKKPTRISYNANFRPLVGVNITWKNGMTSNFRWNTGEKLDESIGVSTGQTRNRTMDMSFTTNYSKRGDFRIPLPFWPFKNMKLKNNVDISLTFNMTKSVTEKSKGAGKFEETNLTEKWSLSPKLTYSFSNRVRGGVSFEIGKTKNKLTGETSIQALNLDVNISIRGN